MLRLILVSWALAALAAAAPASAQSADRTIRIVVPFGGGGGIDSGARALARGLAQELGRPVIVENRPGANSVIGANAVATSPPDGNTLLFTSGSTVAVLPHISRSLPFDPQKDLVPVGKVARLPFVLVANQSVGAGNLQQFVARAKAAPGTLTYASAGSGTGGHLGFELLKRQAGIDVTHVPYKATAEALPDLLTGRVVSMMADPATAKRAVDQGSVRALAVTTRDRSAAFPNVPSVAEQGVDMDLELWFGLFVPRGTPEAVITRLHAAMTAFLKSPAGIKAFEDLGYTAQPTTGKELEQLAQRESAIWAEMARSGVLKIE
jgi:tripartite-type tricarboxylate transporter receptor subunit TctC